ncbi:MAG: B12-binding domain-containing radical SAM protein [Actinobacteria bacterium]|nr:B12-binding domain-containing radical SAM protein [Actinomycetota bacterium]
MRVIFLQSENENLAIEYFSSILQSLGHEVGLTYDHRYFARTGISIPALGSAFDMRNMLADQVVRGRPDLVCFSVMTSDYLWAVDMASRIKARSDVPVLFGGIHAISVPDVVMSEAPVDMVCVGEGEKALPQLLEQLPDFPGIDVPGIWVKNGGEVIRSDVPPLVEDLDAVPFPDKELFYRELPWLSRGYLLITSRGCPYSCTFCGNDVLRKAYKGKGRYVRRRSVESVMSEIMLARERYKPKRFNILDDCFTMNKSWLGEFCGLYADKVRIPFVALSHPQLIDDDVAGMLSDAGCFILLLGIQSSSESIRSEILNRKESNEQVMQAAEICHRHGLRFSIDHIFGLPYEGVEEYRHALSFYNNLRPDAVNTYWLVYFPGTTIIDHAVDAGILAKDDLGRIDRGDMDISLNVGIGRGDRKDSAVGFKNYAFLYSLIPLLPGRVIDFLAKREIYLDGRDVPISVTGALRVLGLIRLGILGIYLEEVFGMLGGFLKETWRLLVSRVSGK